MSGAGRFLLQTKILGKNFLLLFSLETNIFQLFQPLLFIISSSSPPPLGYQSAVSILYLDKNEPISGRREGL